MRGAFHPDDLSAEIGQKRRAPGEHVHLLQREHPDALQNSIISHRHLLLDESQEGGRVVIHVLAEGLLPKDGPYGPVDHHPRRIREIGLPVG